MFKLALFFILLWFSLVTNASVCSLATVNPSLVKIENTDLVITPELLAILREIKEKERQHQIRFDEADGRVHESYIEGFGPVEFIGSGAEGVVYKALDRDGSSIILKRLDRGQTEGNGAEDQKLADSHVENYQFKAELGSRMIPVEVVSDDLIKMPYIEGVSIMPLLTKTSAELGLATGTIEKLLAGYKEFSRRKLSPGNVILVFETGEFLGIDPR